MTEVTTPKTRFKVALVLDSTGSMERHWLETTQAVDGYVLNMLKDDAFDCTLTLYTFSMIPPAERVREHGAFVRPAQYTSLTSDGSTVVPQGSTPLWQAISTVVEPLLETYGKGDRVEICIVTDGMENCSAAGYTKQRAVANIAAAQERGWVVQYLAAGPEAFRAAASFGIAEGHIAQYSEHNVGATLSAAYRTSQAYGATGQSMGSSAVFTEAEMKDMMAPVEPAKGQ